MRAAELSDAWSSGLKNDALLADDVVFASWSDEFPACRGRAEVIALLRSQLDAATHRLPPLAFEDLPGGAVLARGADDETTIAVVVHTEAGRVVRMVQYPSREEAL